jgi:hypothetical protein
MTSARTVLTGRRRWIAAGSMSLALAGAVTQQLVPSPASAAPLVRAAAVQDPTVVEPAADTSDQAPAAAASASPAASPAAAPARPAPKPAQPAKRVKKPTVSSDVCSGPGWQARRGQRALASLRDTGQRSGVTVSFLGAKSGYLGLTYPAAHHVDVFVRSCSAESAPLLRHVVSHEMGHAYDAAHMTSAMRDDYLAMRGIPAGTPWFGCNYCTDFNTPAGDFAETYSQWQRSASDSRTQIAPMPNPSRLAEIAAAFFQD